MSPAVVADGIGSGFLVAFQVLGFLGELRQIVLGIVITILTINPGAVVGNQGRPQEIHHPGFGIKAQGICPEVELRINDHHTVFEKDLLLVDVIVAFFAGQLRLFQYHGGAIVVGCEFGIQVIRQAICKQLPFSID